MILLRAVMFRRWFFYYLWYLIYMSEDWRNDPRFSKIKLSKKEKEAKKFKEEQKKEKKRNLF